MKISPKQCKTPGIAVCKACLSEHPIAVIVQRANITARNGHVEQNLYNK